jgi:hypothetical protein
MCIIDPPESTDLKGQMDEKKKVARLALFDQSS